MQQRLQHSALGARAALPSATLSWPRPLRQRERRLLAPQRLCSSLARRAGASLQAGDERLARQLHRWNAPRWIRLWMLLATRAGDGLLWVAFGLALLARGGAGHWRAFSAAALAAALGILVFSAVKRLCRRQRPLARLAHCWSSAHSRDPFSFPSGHSLTAFAVSTPMLLFWPGLAPALLFCALSVAFSRLLLGMHYLSDVLAGGALGCGLGYLAFHLLLG